MTSPRHTWPPPPLFFQDALGVKWGQRPCPPPLVLSSSSTERIGGAQWINNEDSDWILWLSQSGIGNLKSHLPLSHLIPLNVWPTSPSSFIALLRSPGMAFFMVSPTETPFRHHPGGYSVCSQLPRQERRHSLQRVVTLTCKHCSVSASSSWGLWAPSGPSWKNLWWG